ncbi:autotransporter domain-containing protein [Candidimonas sp. SYP-B2681]|uniref:autotransporter outer membrane beta-barrel domain-containing protein n=1 Tax=Candidimonas sp. SYP-B2681 TaxID=2497686 RepID=UPI000F872F2A|nr:autotransporter outer membrane beta-barrel domain-containing protein [Candidimonas sp. SYP-B2681]RTZ43156.1 autotransporter domain-containing protein [Candidimonas sp. SYP-B2681]
MTIQDLSLWPLKVCCKRRVCESRAAHVGSGIKKILLAAVAVGMAGFVLTEVALASASAAVVGKRADNQLSAVLWSPPPTDTEWIVNEAQLGLPDAPFVFSGDTLYTAGTFESRRAFLIRSLAGIHVQDDSALHLSGVISNPVGIRAGLEKFGAGTLSLSGHNLYNGNTTLHEGTLRISGEQALGNTANLLTVNQGTVVDYAPGATLFNQMRVSGDNSVDESPNGPTPEPASWALADSVQWRVNEGTATIIGPVFGTVPIVKQGPGMLQLNGVIGYPSFLTVNEGVATVDGHMAGSVRVNQGARLEGSGFARTVTVNDGAVFSPGSGVGDPANFVVLEKLEFKPGAIFEVDATAAGRSDQIQVAGKALLDGTVMTRATAGDWQPTTQYTLVHALDGFDGTQFASANTDLAFLTPSLSYDNEFVYLNLKRNNTPLDDVADTPTEDDVADVIDEDVPSPPEVPTPPVTPPPPEVIEPPPTPEGPLPPVTEAPVPDADVVLQEEPPVTEVAQVEEEVATPPKDNQELHDKIVVMDRPQAKEALNQLSGSWAASVRSAMLEDSRFVREAVLRNAGSGSWSEAFYSSGERASQGGTPADQRYIGGLVLGFDKPVHSNGKAGGFLATQHSEMSRRHGMASANIDTIYAGLNLAANLRYVDVALGLAQGWHKVKSQRKIAVGAMYDALTGGYSGRSMQLFGEIAAPLQWLASNAHAITPFARLAWVKAQADGFVEKGGAAATKVLPSDQSVLFSSLGLRASHVFETPKGEAIVQSQLAWHHASGDVSAISRQSFRESRRQTLFKSEGLPVARQAWSLQLGVQASLAKNVSLGMAYGGQYSRGRPDHGARANLVWRF